VARFIKTPFAERNLIASAAFSALSTHQADIVQCTWPVTSANGEFQLRIPFGTMVKVALFLLLVMVTIKIVPLLAVIYVAAMLAVVMAAAVAWLEKKGIRRGVGLTMIAVAILACVLLFLFVVVPAMFGEIKGLIHNAPQIAQRLERQMPAAAPYIKSITAQATSPPKPGIQNEWLARGAIAGWYAVEAIMAIFLTLVIAVYFVMEGRMALAWLVSFASDVTRKKLVLTADEIEPVLLAYMRGQLITSTLAGAVALVTALTLHIPGAIPLAVLAFIGDFVPVLGFIAAIVPALALSLLVSPLAPVVVIAAYATYHLIENYYVVPRVYGRAMRLSTLAVLLTVSFGGLVYGPAGAVLILPLAAAYPPIERIWLRRSLAPDTISKHDAMEGDDEARAERVADDVLNVDERATERR
jgi:predicted PurR-regulated permease PerM